MIFFTAGLGAVRCSDFKLQLDLDTICIQMKDPNRWWPPQIPAPRWREAGQVALATDRGAEKLLLLCQKRDN